MSKGFLWFAQNNSKTDYVELSIKLARSIKKWNRHNTICVVTDAKSKFESEHVDVVKVLKNDDSETHDVKWANEYKAFQLTPFTHTIKLESDMLWTTNTDWWWYHLWQHDLVFAVDCKDYKDNNIKNISYRKLFIRNNLPNIYNGLSYFRRSTHAQEFFKLCEQITLNWKAVKETMLVACHDEYPSTDVVYALAYRIMDPTQQRLINYPWFKFVHNKPDIQGNKTDYLIPLKINDNIIFGSQRLHRVWHYLDKNIPEEIDARIF